MNKKQNWLILLPMLCLLACQPSISNTFNSINGDEHLIIDKNKLATVCLFMSPDCPLTHTYASEYTTFSKNFGDQFNFISVVPGTLYSKTEIQHFQDSFNFKLPIMVDSNYQLTKKWSAEITPTCLVVDVFGKILYTGAIDNWAIDFANKRLKPTEFYLRDALTAIINKEEITVTHTIPIGCLIEFDN